MYFPIFVEDGLLAIGDLHPVRSDGEFGTTPIEVDSGVIIIVDVVKDRKLAYP